MACRVSGWHRGVIRCVGAPPDRGAGQPHAGDRHPSTVRTPLAIFPCRWSRSGPYGRRARPLRSGGARPQAVGGACHRLQHAARRLCGACPQTMGGACLARSRNWTSGPGRWRCSMPTVMAGFAAPKCWQRCSGCASAWSIRGCCSSPVTPRHWTHWWQLCIVLSVNSVLPGGRQDCRAGCAGA